MLNEAHFTYSRETRPRTAVDSSLAADTGMGFGPTFRFGNPFFLQPNVDELIWRTQIKDNVSLVHGHAHLQGRRRVDAHAERSGVPRVLHRPLPLRQRDRLPALRLAGGAPAASAPTRSAARTARYVTAPAPCPAGTTATGGPLLFYLQGAGRIGPGDRRGRRVEDHQRGVLAVRAGLSGRSRPNLTLNYGLRWDAQLMPETVDPQTTAYARVPERPAFPVRRHDPRPVEDVPAAASASRGTCKGNGTSVVRAQRGRLLRAAEHAEPGRLGDDQRPAAADDLREHRNLTAFGAPTPTWPGVLTPAPLPDGQFPLFSGVRVFDRDYKNPRIYRVQRRLRAGSSRRLGRLRRLHLDRGHAPDAVPQLQPQRARSCCDARAGHRQRVHATPAPWGPQLDEVMVTNSRGESRYRGLTLGVRKRFVERLSSSKATTCSRRTRTTTRTSAIRSPTAASTSSISIWTGARRTATSGTRSTLFGYFALPARRLS